MYGEILRYLRKRKKLTMKEFGEIFSLAESTISGYENESRKPDIEILQKFADFFKVSVDDILGRGSIYDIGWIIKEEREEQGVTLEELAKSLSISKGLLAEYEEDFSPINSVLFEKIAEHFGFSVPAFLEKYNLWDEQIPSHFKGDIDMYLTFKKAEEMDAMREPVQPHTIAAHREGEDWTEEELEDIKRFKEFLRSKRKD